MTLAKSTSYPSLRPRRVIYPVRDGKPMAETDKHADIMVYCKESLRLHFAPCAAEVYISGNNFVFWEEGNPKARVSPDVYAVFGAPQRQRDSYKAWEENGLLPSVVVEITSRKTQAEDVGDKFHLYEQVLRVPEYFQFDPTGDYLTPRLQGNRLVSGRYQRILLEGETNDRLYSEQLGLYFVMQNETLRLFNPETGQFLPTLAEAEAKAHAETQRAETEAQRAATAVERIEALDDENARLRAQLDELRKRLGSS